MGVLVGHSDFLNFPHWRIRRGYNHALKNVFFFSGVRETLLNQLFPSPKYVMPNDFIFEFTGVMQAAIFAPTALRFARFSGKIKKIMP